MAAASFEARREERRAPQDDGAFVVTALVAAFRRK
jgi:hypothetical protein